MTVLGKAELLSGQLLKHELKNIKGRGDVWFRELSGDVVREYKRRVKKYQDAGIKDVPDDQAAEMLTYILANSLCDESGALLLTEEEAKGLTVNSLDMLTEMVNKAFEVSGAKKNDNGDIVSEVADNLPNEMTPSSPDGSPRNSDEPAEKS